MANHALPFGGVYPECNQRAHTVPVSFREGRPFAVLVKANQCLFDLLKQRFDGVKLSGMSQRPGMSDTEPGLGAHCLVGQCIQPPDQSPQLTVVYHCESISCN